MVSIANTQRSLALFEPSKLFYKRIFAHAWQLHAGTYSQSPSTRTLILLVKYVAAHTADQT